MNIAKHSLDQEETVTRQEQSQAVVEWMQAAVGEDEDMFATIVRVGSGRWWRRSGTGMWEQSGSSAPVCGARSETATSRGRW